MPGPLHKGLPSFCWHMAQSRLEHQAVCRKHSLPEFLLGTAMFWWLNIAGSLLHAACIVHCPSSEALNKAQAISSP